MAEYKDNLLGEANSFLEVLEQVSHLAPLDKPVLIIGERGTGKELIASRLHYLSSRWQGPFISLNCAVTPNASTPLPICRITRSPAGARCACHLPRWARLITACAIVWAFNFRLTVKSQKV